jgi:hypothetical protein
MDTGLPCIKECNESGCIKFHRRVRVRIFFREGKTSYWLPGFGSALVVVVDGKEIWNERQRDFLISNGGMRLGYRLTLDRG